MKLPLKKIGKFLLKAAKHVLREEFERHVEELKEKVAKPRA